MQSPSRSGLLGHILNPLHIILLLGVFFSVALLLVRIQVTGSFRYGFLLWNMFLAGLPLAAAVILKWLQHNHALKTWVGHHSTKPAKALAPMRQCPSEVGG